MEIPIFHNANEPWLYERTILLARTGSYAYGTNTEQSDLDYKGVCIPPIDYYLGLKSFNEYNTTGGKNFKNTKDDIDITIMHINKFVKDAMSGAPNNIELLFIRKEDYLILTPHGKILINHRHWFLSKQIYKKFAGYAHSQIQKLKKQHSEGTGQSFAFGYDTKGFMHSIRLLTSAIEILETGDFSTYRTNREELRNCRNGKYTFEEALELISTYDEQLKKALEQTSLPEKPDYNKINQLLVQINQTALHIK